MMKTKDRLICKRCGHVWKPKTDTKKRKCPSCSSFKWNECRHVADHRILNTKTGEYITKKEASALVNRAYSYVTKWTRLFGYTTLQELIDHRDRKVKKKAAVKEKIRLEELKIRYEFDKADHCFLNREVCGYYKECQDYRCDNGNKHGPRYRVDRSCWVEAKPQRFNGNKESTMPAQPLNY
jgi:hypothetical protein